MLAIATRGSRRIFLSFWRPRAVFTSTRSPSRSTHTGVTCGLPSGMSVARLANARLVKRSRYLSGMDCDMSSSLLELQEQHYRRCGRCESSTSTRDFPLFQSIYRGFDQAINRVGNALGLNAQFIRNHRENDLLAFGRDRVSGKAFDAAERPRLAKDVGRRIQIFETVGQRTITACDRKRAAEFRAPRLTRRILKKLDNGMRRDQVLPGQAGSIIKVVLVTRYPRVVQKSTKHFQPRLNCAGRSFFAA